MINVVKMIPRRVRRKVVANAGACVVKVTLGVGCEIATYVCSKRIINKIEDHEEKKRLESREPIGFQTV